MVRVYSCRKDSEFQITRGGGRSIRGKVRVGVGVINGFILKHSRCQIREVSDIKKGCVCVFVSGNSNTIIMLNLLFFLLRILSVLALKNNYYTTYPIS